MSEKFSSGTINPKQTKIIDRYRSLTDIGGYLKKNCVWDGWAKRMIGGDIGNFFFSQLSLSGHLPGTPSYLCPVTSPVLHADHWYPSGKQSKTAVTLLKYCRYGVKRYPINQSINQQSKMAKQHIARTSYT